MIEREIVIQNSIVLSRLLVQIQSRLLIQFNVIHPLMKQRLLARFRVLSAMFSLGIMCILPLM